MSERIDEFRLRLSQGESFADQMWGTGWEMRFPSLAVLSNYAGIGRGSCEEKVDFSASVRSGTHFHSTDHEILKVTAHGTPNEASKWFDKKIEEWLETNGEEKLRILKQGWMHGEKWKLLYPAIAKWSAGGKRYCFSLKYAISGKAEIKAWFFDKAAYRETILLEETVANHERALDVLNCELEFWFEHNSHLLEQFKYLDID